VPFILVAAMSGSVFAATTGLAAGVLLLGTATAGFSSGTGQGKRVDTVDPITIEVIDASLGCTGKRRG
jgi:hypothetical protein